MDTITRLCSVCMIQAELEARGSWVVRANAARGAVARAAGVLRAHPLSGRDYDDFPLQEDALQVCILSDERQKLSDNLLI